VEAPISKTCAPVVCSRECSNEEQQYQSRSYACHSLTVSCAHRSGPVLDACTIAVLITIWLLVLVPSLFLHTEWFGRPLSDQQIGEYLHAHDPALIEHALNQIGDRMARHDKSVDIWYPECTGTVAGHGA
jgi:hypothetical protein